MKNNKNTLKNKTVRIGCASAFYGDSQLSARQLVDGGNLDYLVFDYLAEITMAILARSKAKHDHLGYALDFVDVAMKDVLADCAKQGIKVVANAGGMNVPGCIAALEALCEEQGLNLKIAGVYGDDLTANAPVLKNEFDLSENQTAAPLPENLSSMNAYLGGAPVAAALAAGADVVITGRVVDCAVVIGPLLHEFGWELEQYNEIAQGALAGHVIECGAQCTGGNFTDWHLVPDFSDMSYPIAAVSYDGSFVVEIPANTGGMVSVGTVAEQIVYEIGDPANYLLPDVSCDFSNVVLEQVAENKVRVSNARGRAPGNQYKVCATYVDGYKLMGQFFMGGQRSALKARTSLEAWVQRTSKAFAQRELGDYRDVSLEIIGNEDTYGPHATVQDTREVMAKFGLHHDSKEALVFASREMAFLAAAAAPGMSGFAAGRPRPQPLMRIHSTLIDKNAVPVKIQLGKDVLEQRVFTAASSEKTAKCQFGPEVSAAQPSDQQAMVEVPLEQLAYGRSGDKGNNANVGIIARKAEYLPFLYQQLTATAVAEFFAHLVEGDVERFEVPGFHAFNFFMTEALGGGGTASLRLDSQGKAFAQMLLSKMIKVPKGLLD